MQRNDLIFERLQANNPSPTTELEYHSVFELLIAVILSAQATDISVNKATKPLFAVANTPHTLFALGEEQLKSYIRSIGLFHSKARHIIQTCALLIERHNGEVPNTREELTQLPGVGRKTANVILNTAFGQDTIAVDTHILRVAQRLELAKSTTPLGVEKELMSAISPKYIKNAHHWLILHGRYTCKAKNPQCAHCILNDLCQFPEKTKKAF